MARRRFADARRLTARVLAVCVFATAGVAAAWGVASGATAHDLRGTFTVHVCPGATSGPCNTGPPQTYTITAEDQSTGAFSGNGAGNGQTWKVTGTVNGSTLSLTDTESGYNAHITATIGGDSNSFSGTYTDSSSGSGTVTGVRTSGPPTTTTTTSTTTTRTTTTSTSTTVLGNNPILQELCFILYAQECAGYPPPNAPIACVSLYQNCNGFGGSKPAQPGTIDMKGLKSIPIPKPVTNTFVSDPVAVGPVSCNIHNPPAAGAQARVAASAPSTCVVKLYLQTTTPIVNAQEKYVVNSEQFAVEVAARKADILLRVKEACQNACPKFSSQSVTNAITELTSQLTNTLSSSFSSIAKPGKPAPKTAPKIDLKGFCATYGSAAPNGCKELQTAINQDLAAASVDLSSRKTALGLDKPVVLKKKGVRKLPVVLLDGQAVLPAGSKVNMAVNFPASFRRALGLPVSKASVALSRSVVPGVLVVQASVADGVTTTHSVNVRVKLH
jgi:hypothetical protein